MSKSLPSISWPSCILGVVVILAAHALAWKYDAQTTTACLLMDGAAITTLVGAKALDMLGLEVKRKD